MRIKDKDLRAYLLGNAEDAVAEEVDLRIISDLAFEAELLAAEESLIEDYLEKSLSTDELRLFNSNFAISEDRISQINLIHGLQRLANREETPEDSLEKEESSFSGNWIDSVRQTLTAQPSFLIATSAAVLLLLAVVGWFTIFSNDISLIKLESEYAALNKDDLSSSVKTTGAGRIDLIPGTTRSGDNSGGRVIKAQFEEYLFVLDISSVPTSAERYRIEIEKSESKLFAQSGLKIYDNNVGSELRFLIPVSALKAGEHRIKVSLEGTGTEPEYYYFSVE